MNNYKIIMTGHGHGKVFCNGEELKGVKAIKFSCSADEINTILLSYTADTIEIEAECEESDV